MIQKLWIVKYTIWSTEVLNLRILWFVSRLVKIGTIISQIILTIQSIILLSMFDTLTIIAILVDKFTKMNQKNEILQCLCDLLQLYFYYFFFLHICHFKFASHNHLNKINLYCSCSQFMFLNVWITKFEN